MSRKEEGVGVAGMVGHVLSRGVVNKVIRTLFADERVVPVVGIVSVAKSSMRIFKFEKLVAMLARMTRASSFFFVDSWRAGKICVWGTLNLRGGNRAERSKSAY